MTNHDQARVFRLKSRKWIITDGEGNKSFVEGEGVLGLHPILHPRTKYCYTSYAEIATLHGTMQGNYTFDELKFENSSWKIIRQIETTIAPFGLLLPPGISRGY